MNLNSFQKELQWVSVILRLSIGSLFLVAAILKLPGGVTGTVAYYDSLFQDSLLPTLLVKSHATVIMFVEFILCIWLFIGYRLRLAWIVSSLVLVSLAAGMVFAAKYDVASDNYIYVFLSLIGLLIARFDNWVIGVD